MMPKPQSAELTRFLNQRVCLWLNGRRKTEGTLTGFDNMMNLVLEDTVDVTKEGQQKNAIVCYANTNGVLYSMLCS